jgi:predicted dinucleotide-binding enzyme
MRIAVLGTGDVSGTLGKRWAQKGHIVIFGSRNPHDEKVHKLLAEDLGFEPVDCGGLKRARYLEPLALLWINLAVVQSLGRNIAFKLIRR